MYKLSPTSYNNVESTGVIRLLDGACIPFDEANTDYQDYLKWLDGYESIDGEWVQTNPEGNTPIPADV
jgi:hypothetical protein